ncbi:TetR/AcrR family transcriptional regulator [Nonomuraea sp. bgisy101]|uniref:TetR/AcrR family transcriptional regulator n=1 Tax=Nonomuraea sp. bgisy101 TaxID=3413784 RepID=UPI003D70DBC4
MVTSGRQAAEETTDKRLLRGAQSRRTVTRRAVDIASLDGLDGLSFGRLAEDLGISKAGIQTLFRTKEGLQLATVEAARESFVDAVIRPALRSPAGVARIRALVDRWIDYAVQPLFSGGCFWGANLPEFDSRPGPVRDVLRRQQRAWHTTLATQFRRAVARGEIAEIDPESAAFQVSALLSAVNLAVRLGDDDRVAMARHVIDGLLTHDSRHAVGAAPLGCPQQEPNMRGRR